MANAKTLKLEITPFNSNPQVVEFDVSESKEAFEKISERCHWNLNKPINSSKESTGRRKLSYKKGIQKGQEIGEQISNKDYNKDSEIRQACFDNLLKQNLYTEDGVSFFYECVRSYKKYHK